MSEQDEPKEEPKRERIDFEDELHRYGRAQPFTPFEIVVASGDRYQITNSDHLAFTGNTVVVAEPKTGIRFFRRNQIVAVHVQEPVTDLREELGRRLTATPFQPFEIITAEGQRYPVTRKFQAALGASVVIIAPLEGDTVNRIPIDTIRSIKMT